MYEGHNSWGSNILAFNITENKVSKPLTENGLLRDTAQVGFFISNGTILNNLTLRVQLEEGDTATEYVEHQSETYQLSNLPEMYSENDYIYKKDKKWFVHNTFKRVIFKGIENWRLQSINNNGISNFIRQEKFDYKYPNPKAFITSFKLQNTLIANTVCEGFILNEISDLYVRINSSIADTVEKFKTWLSENPQEFIYLAETPTDTEITDSTLIKQLNELEKLFTYENTNYFIVTNEKGQACNLEVTAYKNTFKIMQTKISELETKIDALIVDNA